MLSLDGDGGKAQWRRSPLLGVVACSTQVSPAPTTASVGAGAGGASDTTQASSSSGPPTPPGTYVLDFTQSKLGGLEFGSNVNVAFTIDLQNPLRTFAIQTIDTQVGPGLDARDDANKVCELPAALQEIPQIQQHLQKLGPGDFASVKRVNLEITLEGKQPQDLSQLYCFAYRDQSGVWHGDEATFKRTLNEETHMFEVEIPIDKNGIDGLYLVTTDGASVLTTITYTTGS